MKHYPCAVCKKSVLNQHKAICCDHCNQWVHIKCNDLNDLDYNLLKSNNEFWYCILCTSEIFPFCTVYSVMPLPKGSLNKPTGALINLMNQLNNFTTTWKKMNWNCQTINIEIKIISKSFPGTSKGRPCPFFHINVHLPDKSLLTKNFDDFNILSNDLNINFDILAITKSHIKKD